MRRVLYVDLAETLMLIASAFDDDWDNTEHCWETFRHYLSTDGADKYIANNQEVFTHLFERPHFAIMFEQFKLIAREQDKRTAVDKMLQTFHMFKHSIEGRGFEMRSLRMAVGKWRANNLIEAVNRVIDDNPLMLRASV